MKSEITHFIHSYPRQFWLMFWGMLISTIGSAMIWPFIMIFLTERLDASMTAVGGLYTLNSVVGVVATLLVGPVIDRAGRKWVMAISLGVNGLVYLLMTQAGSLLQFAALMSLSGAFNPLYRMAADAMLADLITPEKRADAYSLLRTSNNVGVAAGPVIGGILIVSSYNTAYVIAGLCLLAYSLLVTFGAVETLPAREAAVDPVSGGRLVRERWGGYGRVLGNRHFMSFVGAFSLTQVSMAILWLFLGVYVKEGFGIIESQYSTLPLTNALMVIFFQLAVTQVTKRRAPLSMMALGALIYGISVGGVAWAQSYPAFWLCMVVMTVGELILSPTATTYAAGLAPADMRGRYMSLYGLSWNFAAGVGSLLAGILSDTFSPAAMWYGGGAAGFLALGAFLVLHRERQAAERRTAGDAI
jgi:MFS family permease